MPFSDLPQDMIDRLNVLDLAALKAFRFAVQVDGLNDLPGFLSRTVAGFNEVDGLSERIDVREVREGGYPAVHKFPRKIRTQPVALMRGMTFSRALFNWYQQVANWTKGEPDYRKNVSLFLIDTVHAAGIGKVDYEVWRWEIRNAWPSQWQGPKLNSTASALAFESITLEHSGLSEGQGILSGVAGEIAGVLQ